MIYFLLFLEFFKIGLFAVGGGLATIPFLYRLSDAYGWISRAQIADMIAVAESTPGPIGINVATYTGFHVAGLAGSAVATAAFILPSILIVTLITRFMRKFKDNAGVAAVFDGLRPAATGLIAAVSIGVGKLALYDPNGEGYLSMLKWREVALFIVLFYLVRKFQRHPVSYIVLAGIVGVVLKL